MIIKTKRLDLVPLTPRQLSLWTQDLPALERELSCAYRAEPVEGIFLDIVRCKQLVAAADESNYLWHSFWFLIRREDRTAVGSIDFKNVPDPSGGVEIGYGLGKEFEKNGYMTEAVKALCSWALRQPQVKHILAETGLNAAASQHILQRCGFSLEKLKDTAWWKL